MYSSHNFKIEDLPIVMLGSFGHAGIDWIHSLLDNHEEILIMPAFSFFRTLDRVKKGNKINLEKASYIEIAKALSNTFLLDQAYQLKRRKFIENEEKRHEFENSLLKYLEYSKENNLKKKIFYGIHYAFSEIYKLQLNKKKAIVVHEHVSWHCEEYQKIFGSKFLIIFRDPRATLAGGILKMSNSNSDNIINSFQLDTMILDMLSAFNFLKKNKNEKIVYALVNEVIHQDLKKEMNSLAQWLNIKYSDTLTQQTFMNEKWLGESSYLAKGELREEPPKDFYNPSKVEERWRSILSKNEILMIETIFRDTMTKFKFSFDNEFNLFKLIKGYKNYFFMHQHQQKFYLNKYLILFRNLLRRLLIILIGSKTKNFFSFK
jgi:hypothetical protein